MESCFYLNLKLNGLLVTCQIDNTSQEGNYCLFFLVPGSHKRCELGHSHQAFQQRRKRIREVIPVPNSLWKGASFVRFFASLFTTPILFRSSMGILALSPLPLSSSIYFLTFHLDTDSLSFFDAQCQRGRRLYLKIKDSH